MLETVFKKCAAVATGSVTVLAAFACGANAQDDSLGKSLYMESCAVCHGSSGRGHGEFSQYLTVKPAELTVLSQNNGGEFPYLYVLRTVDGRAVVRGHGSGEMPIWGNLFSRDLARPEGQPDLELMIKARLVAWRTAKSC